MKRLAIVFALVVLLVPAIAQETATPDPTLIPTSTETPIALPTLTATLAPLATVTENPTSLLTPTETTLPTGSPIATNVYTETPTTPSFPSETPFIASTETLSGTPTPSSTPVMLPNTVWTPVFSDSFGIANTVDWLFTGTGWGYEPHDGGNRLRVFNSSSPVFYQGNVPADTAIEITVDVSVGNAHLYAHHSSAGTYEAQLTSVGDVILKRAGIILAERRLPNFIATQPHRFRLNIIDTQLWVDVEGITQLTAVDLSPLPAGDVGFGASFLPLPAGATPTVPTYSVTFDDFTLYYPVDSTFSINPVASETPTAFSTSMSPLDGNATPTFPLMELPPLGEARLQSFAASEPIEIANGDVLALKTVLLQGGNVTINLAADGEYVLTGALYNLFAPTGLPIIYSGSNITINGRGATLRADASGFRLLGIDQGTLTLNNIVLRDATLFTNGGAAIINSRGVLNLNNVRMENNRVVSDSTFGRGTGGAVYTFFGRTTINNSTFIDNYAVKYGGGLYSWDGVILLNNTRFENNAAGVHGGALASRDENPGYNNGEGITSEGGMYIANSAGASGGAFYIESGEFSEQGGLIQGNTAVEQGGVLFSGPSGDPEITNVAPDVAISESDLTGNTSPLIVSTQTGAGTFDFSNNWWGTPNGPAVNDLVGSGIVTDDPFPGPSATCSNLPSDSDNDCLTDAFELMIPGLSSSNADSDGDGVGDANEDADNDALINLNEFLRGTNPVDADSDDDSLNDGAEVNLYDTNPLNSESDGDGLNDNFEVNRSLTNAALPDTDSDGITDDLEDPDGDGLTNAQEFRLGTDPQILTTLGAPSRLRSETVLTPTQATADGTSMITVETVVRDAQGHFLPNYAITWTTSNANLITSATSGVTDEDGVASIEVSSTVVTSGVVEIRVLGIVIGRPLVTFIGGDSVVRFTATSSGLLLPGQTVNAAFEVMNEGVRPIADVEVVANLPFGVGVIETVQAAVDVELQGQGSNAATWNIPLLEVGERRVFAIRFRVGATLGLNTAIPLTVQTSAIDDTNTSNNSASFSASIVANLGFPIADQQSNKLAITFISDPTVASIGQTVNLMVTVENLSSEPLFNLSGFTPLLGNNYPNVAFVWNTPAQPGYLAPAGNGDASRTSAQLAFTLPVGYPFTLTRVLAVQAIDNDPTDGSVVVKRDNLTDAELGILGPNLQTSLTADRTSAVAGDLVTFTLTVTNSSAATDSATNLQVIGNFIVGVQTLSPLAPGASTVYTFTHVVTAEDVPQLTAQVQLTGQGVLQTGVVIQNILRRTVTVIGGNVAPGSANLTFEPASALTFLYGRSTPLPLTIRNAGALTAQAVRLRLNVPFGLDVDPASLGSGSFDLASRVITWEVGTLTAGNIQTFAPAFLPLSSVPLGTELVFDALLSTSSNETSLDDNTISPSGRLEQPAAAKVTVNATPRNWLIADNSDDLTLNITVYDQLGSPLSGANATWSSSLVGVSFDPMTLVSDTNGQATTTVKATQVGAVEVIATFANGVLGSTTLNRRSSAVSLTRSPASIGIGGTDRYSVFVVNTATLPDGTTGTGDLVDLTFTLPTELPANWFQFEQPTLALGFGDFVETQFRVTIPPASALTACQSVVGTYPFTVTATGRTLGVVGEVQGQLTIVAQTPELTHVVPANAGRVGGDQVLFSWRSNTPGNSTVYYRQQGEATYTSLPMVADALDPRLYRAVLDVSGAADGTIFQWYGIIDNGCSARTLASATQPQTFTRVESTTFVDSGYDFTVADGYNLTTTTSGGAMTIRVRNDDSVARAILLDVDNPYDDLIIGFTGSGSVDQVVMLAPGQSFEAPLRLFTQETEREVYSLALRLENDQGVIDRVPLIIRVRQPLVDLDIQVLSVDDRTLVTNALLTNRGDTVTDLSLDIVQASSGIPANFVIQPDIQHTYLLAGQTLEIAFIPLDLQDATTPLGSPASLNGSPSLMAIPGPYRVTATARSTSLPDVTLRDGTLNNTCGVDGSERTVVAECTTPAGSETRFINDWYCTNRPNIDVPISLALPNGGLGVPITSVDVAANFSPGSGVYTHSTTVRLNGSVVGSAIVPSQSLIEGSVAPQSLILGGNSPTQIFSLRSTHSNDTHYTIASGFTVTVAYDEHTRTGCFTPAEVAAAAGGSLMCTVDPSLEVPTQSLGFSLAVDESALPENRTGDTNTFVVGEQIPLIARVSASGATNISDTVRIELTVPSGLQPTGMTIQGEDQSLLDLLFGLLNQINPDLGGLLNDLLGIDVADEQVTFTYDYDRDLVVGQSFPITLDVVGEVVGEYTISGVVTLATEVPTAPQLRSLSEPIVAQQQEDPTPTIEATDTQIITIAQLQPGEREQFIQQITTQCIQGASVVIDLNESIVLEVANNDDNNLGQNGLPPIICNLTINGNDHTIDGNEEFRIFYVAAGASLTLNSITLQNGRAIGAGGAAIIALDNSRLTIEDSKIINNVATSQSLTLQGGGIYASKPASVVVRRTSFKNNTVISAVQPTPATPSSQGGALSIAAVGNTTVELSNTYFESNTAAMGAAFRMYNDTSTMAQISLTNSCIGDHGIQPSTLSIQPPNIIGTVDQLWLANQDATDVGVNQPVLSDVGFTEQQCIDPQQFPPRPDPTDLSTYGVQIVYDGNFWNQTMQEQETQNVMEGVQLIAEALELLGVRGNTPQERFKSVFVESLQGGNDLTITVLRLHPNDQPVPPNTPYGYYYNAINANCVMNDAEDGTSDTPLGYVIACRGFQNTTLWNPQPPEGGTLGYGILTTEAFIHEMGHIIDARYGLRDTLFSTILYDCRPIFSEDDAVMRVIRDPSGFALLRGSEGWGSAGLEVSRFQQNVSSTNVETSPDLFLNWVYRITSDDAGYFDPSLVVGSSSPIDYLCGYKPPQANENNIPLSALSPANVQLAHDQGRTQWEVADANWSGFRNINANGNFADNGVTVVGRQEYLPGNARYTRFHNRLLDTLTQNGLIEG